MASSPEQVVRDFVTTFNNKGPRAAESYLSDNMIMTIDNPPMRGGKDMYVSQGKVMTDALPDFKWTIQDLSTQGNQVTAHLQITGTQRGDFRLSSFDPHLSDLPATGKKVSVPATFTYTVQNDKITGIRISAPPDGGVMGMVSQLRGKM